MKITAYIEVEAEDGQFLWPSDAIKAVENAINRTIIRDTQDPSDERKSGPRRAIRLVGTAEMDEE